MPDFIGNIAVPEITPSGVFPLTPDYPLEVRRDHEVAVHQFGSGNAKIEQRFLLGTGARRFTIRKQWLRDAERIALRNFWEQKYGPYGAFTYNAPNDDGVGTTPVICRFVNEPLSWEMVADWACSLGVTLIEIPQETPSYPLNQTVNRFPPAALQAALLSQVQEIIPLIRIQPLETGYPAIYVSDRRATVGSQLYQARLIEFDGISQSIGNESDEASFTFGNADRVMRDLANDVDLFRAEIAFSLFHVGTGTKVDLWKGNIVNWSCDSGSEFHVAAADGLYELNLPYPTRRISRTCWKQFKGTGCPYSGPHESCDKGFDTPNGCRSHGMDNYFGGIIAKPQGVRIKDNSTGVWGFGRSTLTSVSLVADSIYDQVVPEIYTDSPMPVNAKIAMGRDESDFYAAVGIVGEGPLGAYGAGHKLDGQPHHGYPGPLGLMTSLGTDPNPTPFGLDTDNPVERAAGTAFVMLRRSDAKGLQLSRLSEHSMEVIVGQGLGGWIWTGPGNRAWQPALINPIWIAVNMLLRARGIRMGANATSQQLDFAETLFDVDAGVAAAAICDEQVSKLVGTGSETQFKFRGLLQEEKPLRDWLQEVLMNCLGYYTFAFGKLKLGVRVNSSAVEAFTEGNILFRSLHLAPLKPSFNHLTANFADEDFEFVGNSISLYDIDHATLVGAAGGPLFLKSSINLSGTASKSQAARVITVRLREELGGITPVEWERARHVAFKTTVLALNTEPGMVCSLTHPDMPGGAGKFRVTGWRLNGDYSIDVQGRTVTDSMYDLISGPKPADVQPDPVPAPPTFDLIPGPVSGIELVEIQHDGLTAQITLRYTPPDPLGYFVAVKAYGRMPAAADIVPTDLGSAPYSPDAQGRGTIRVTLTQPAGGARECRIWLCSQSAVLTAPLDVDHTPSITIDVQAATLGGTPSPPSQPGVNDWSVDAPVYRADAIGAQFARVRVVVTTLPADADYLEVWLDAASGSYKPVGVLSAIGSSDHWEPQPRTAQAWQVKLVANKFGYKLLPGDQHPPKTVNIAAWQGPLQLTSGTCSLQEMTWLDVAGGKKRYRLKHTAAGPADDNRQAIRVYRRWTDSDWNPAPGEAGTWHVISGVDATSGTSWTWYTAEMDGFEAPDKHTNYNQIAYVPINHANDENWSGALMFNLTFFPDGGFRADSINPVTLGRGLHLVAGKLTASFQGVANGDFEAGLDGWTYSGGGVSIISGAHAHSGNTLQLAPNQNDQMCWQYIPALPGQVFRLEAIARTSTSAPSLLALQWRTPNQSWIDQEVLFVTGDTYALRRLVGTAPPSTGWVAVMIYAFSGSGQFRVDNITLTLEEPVGGALTRTSNQLEVADWGITEQKLASLAASERVLANLSVTFGKLATYSVGWDKIAEYGISSHTKLADNVLARSALFGNAVIQDAAIANLHAQKINAGEFTGRTLFLDLNGVTTEIRNSYDYSFGAYAGVTVKLTSLPWQKTLITAGGLAAGNGQGYITLEMTGGGANGSGAIAVRNEWGWSTVRIFGHNGAVRALQYEDTYGNKVVGQRQSAIANPSGGFTVDTEARIAISNILTALRNHGLIYT